jgi:2'-5' RNA ligase
MMMGSDLDGVHGRVPAEELLNIFALVIYIPDPLGMYLDDLRRELVPHYNPHAHVSVLPPRPLGVTWQTASGEAEAVMAKAEPFEVELTDVSVFPITGVVYLEVGRGGGELRSMHQAMNRTSLAFQEPFVYHPHITLAQELPTGGEREARDLAERRWKEYTGPRSFQAEHAVFVQSTLNACWIDLAEIPLGVARKR